VMASQIYSMARQFRSGYSSVMTSRFVIDYGKCSFAAQQIGRTLASGMERFGIIGDENDIIVSRIVNNEWRIAMQVRVPGTAAFDQEARLLKSLVRCGINPWCQGKEPPNRYDSIALAILERKKAGEKVDLPGCGITTADFKPLGWEITSPPESRVDALSLIAFSVEAVSLLYLLWRPKGRSA
jgi:hypothetical protein